MLFFRPTALTVSKLVVINHITFRSCRVIRKLNNPSFLDWLNSYITTVLHKNKLQFEGEDLKVCGKLEIIL